MIDHDTARAKLLSYLSTIPPKDSSGWAVVDYLTREYDIGWLFFWTVKSNLTRTDPAPMAGNVPILVHNEDGALYAWSVLYPIENLLDRLRADRGSVRRLDRPAPG